jgi:hypothetical protein
MMNTGTVAMEDVEGRFGRPEIMMASSNLMQKVLVPLYTYRYSY